MTLCGFFETEVGYAPRRGAGSALLEALQAIAAFRAVAHEGNDALDPTTTAATRAEAIAVVIASINDIRTQFDSSRARFDAAIVHSNTDTSFDHEKCIALLNLYDAALDDLHQIYSMIAIAATSPFAASKTDTLRHAPAPLLKTLWANASTPLLNEIKTTEKIAFASFRSETSHQVE